MNVLENPYKNGKKSFSDDIADGDLMYHKDGYIDKKGNVFDITGNYLYNIYEKKED